MCSMCLISILILVFYQPMSSSFLIPDDDMRISRSDDENLLLGATELRNILDGKKSEFKNENILMENPIVHSPDGQKKFQLQFDVRQFKPEEIVVKTAANQLSVHARHEEKDSKSVFREYSVQYTIPEDINPESLISKISRDGLLTIEAPLPAEKPMSTTFLIPDDKKRISRSESENSLPGKFEQTNKKLDREKSEFKIEVDLKNFEPENIQVKTQGNLLVILARLENDLGYKEEILETRREFVIPVSVDRASIVTWLTEDGILTITAGNKQHSRRAEVIYPSTEMDLLQCPRCGL